MRMEVHIGQEPPHKDACVTSGHGGLLSPGWAIHELKAEAAMLLVPSPWELYIIPSTIFNCSNHASLWEVAMQGREHQQVSAIGGHAVEWFPLI